MELYFVGTEYQLADRFTKALLKERFEYLVYRIVFIIAQTQRQADVHQDELCPPNKRYALMDANKKIDLEHPLCPNESKIRANILQNHPLRFNITASSSVPWIYLGQFWHTLKEDGSKYKLSFVLDRKEITITLDDFRTIFHLPQATENNHDHFVPASTSLEMVPFYINNLGFTLELSSPSNFKTIDHADAILLLSHYMTAFPEISRRARDKYHNLEDDDMVKSIFNSGKHKDRIGIKILSWMLTDEMNLTDNYRMYVAEFGVDVPTTQSRPIESTQGTHRTTSAPRMPNPVIAEGVSSAPQNLAEQKSHEELEAKENEEKVKENLMAEEIEKFEEGTKNAENVEVNTSILRKDDNQTNPGTRLEPRSNKESLEVEIIAAVQPVNVNEEEEESAEDDYELKRMEKGKLTVNDPPPSFSTPSSYLPKSKLSPTNRLLSLFKPKTRHFKHYKSFFDELQGCYEYLFEHLKIRFTPRKKFHVLAQHLQDIMEESLPKMVDFSVKNYMSGHILHVHPTQASTASTQEEQYNLYLTMRDNPQLPSAVRLRDQDDPHDDAHPEGENDVKRQKTSEHGTYVIGESSDGEDNESKLLLSMSDVDEMSHIVDEERLRKVVDEILRQRCTSRDEHQYHIDQMRNFLKNNIIDPKALALSLVNQDLLYLKKGSSGPEKIVMSLNKFPAIIFPDDDIEERTSRWVDKCMKKFNPYAR
ncbi:hypothetical protein Tco_0472068 [Tanacetum coccineum]